MTQRLSLMCLLDYRRRAFGLWATVTSNGSPYATGPLSCLFLMLEYCGQTVGWIKMSLGTEVDHGRGDIVLDGDPAPPTERGTAALTYYCCAEFGWNRRSSFDNMRLREFGLKITIQLPQIGI